MYCGLALVLLAELLSAGQDQQLPAVSERAKLRDWFIRLALGQDLTEYNDDSGALRVVRLDSAEPYFGMVLDSNCASTLPGVCSSVCPTAGQGKTFRHVLRQGFFQPLLLYDNQTLFIFSKDISMFFKNIQMFFKKYSNAFQKIFKCF